jgi:hypothetical protein
MCTVVSCDRSKILRIGNQGLKALDPKDTTAATTAKAKIPSQLPPEHSPRLAHVLYDRGDDRRYGREILQRRNLSLQAVHT